MTMSFVTKLNFWRRKCYRIRLDCVLSLSWFHHRDDSIISEGEIHRDLWPRWITPQTPSSMINTTVCSSSLFSTDLQTYQYQLDHVNSMFLNCLCSSIFLENSKVYVPFLFTNGLKWISIPMILGFFLHDRTLNFARSMCVSLRSKQS